MRTFDRKLVLQAILAAGILGGYSANAMATLVFTNANNSSSVSAFDGDISGIDLINNGNVLRSGATTSGSWGATGTYPTTQLTNAAGTGGYFLFSGAATATAEYTFDTSVNIAGYNITQISSIAGFSGQSNYGNQFYEIFYSLVGTPIRSTSMSGRRPRHPKRSQER